MKNRIENWATENALTLVFISILFVLLCIWIVISDLFFSGGHSGA